MVWGQEVFVIPYRWSGGSDKSAVSEVVLYLSQDQGASWNEVTRARPDVQSFMYRAPRDGEYWFAIRTIDATGNAWPNGPMERELCVVVDTRLPTIVINSSTLTAGGQLTVSATATDPQIDAASLAVAVQDPSTMQWRSLQASVSNSTLDSATVTATGSLPPGTRNARVRVTAKDRAGNPASAGGSASVTGLPTHSASTTMPAPVAIVPPDPFTRSSAYQPQPPSQPPAVAGGTWQSQPLASRPNGTSWQSSATPSQPWRPDNQALPSVSARRSAPGEQIASSSQPSGYRFASTSNAPQLPPTDLKPPLTQRMTVNSNRFELQYNLRSIGPWGVSKVEVWGTEDRGQTWRSFAIDTDQRSPVDVQTPGDGLYGFTILVQSVGGLEHTPPRSGDQPNVLVEVDRTRPQASLVSASQPDGYFADHLIFTWQVQDANLADRPISLLFAAKPSGPWQPIASNLENTGRYSWRLQRHLPSEVYVRLEARDRAGNIGADQSNQPVAIRLPESSGQILHVRPLQ